MHVRPAPGCAVRDPFTRELLPEAGADVPDTDFWLRRLLQGDVTPGGVPAHDVQSIAPTEPVPAPDVT